ESLWNGSSGVVVAVASLLCSDGAGTALHQMYRCSVYGAIARCLKGHGESGVRGCGNSEVRVAECFVVKRVESNDLIRLIDDEFLLVAAGEAFCRHVGDHGVHTRIGRRCEVAVVRNGKV